MDLPQVLKGKRRRQLGLETLTLAQRSTLDIRPTAPQRHARQPQNDTEEEYSTKTSHNQLRNVSDLTSEVGNYSFDNAVLKRSGVNLYLYDRQQRIDTDI